LRFSGWPLQRFCASAVFRSTGREVHRSSASGVHRLTAISLQRPSAQRSGASTEGRSVIRCSGPPRSRAGGHADPLHDGNAQRSSVATALRLSGLLLWRSSASAVFRCSGTGSPSLARTLPATDHLNFALLVSGHPLEAPSPGRPSVVAVGRASALPPGASALQRSAAFKRRALSGPPLQFSVVRGKAHR